MIREAEKRKSKGSANGGYGTKLGRNPKNPTHTKNPENRGTRKCRGKRKRQEFKQSQAVYQIIISRVRSNQWRKIIPLMAYQQKLRFLGGTRSRETRRGERLV